MRVADPETRFEAPRVAFASAATVAVLLILTVTCGQVLTSYRIWGDDFALVLNSSPPYTALRDWTLWFTQGYSGYFDNYPDWPSIGTGFARPLVNLAFYISGATAPRLGEWVYLAPNYLAVVCAVFVSAMLLLRVPGARPLLAALLAVSVGVSSVWHTALFEASFLTTALATLLGVGAVAVLSGGDWRPSAGRVAVAVTLLVLGVAAHEALLVAPLVCVALLWGLSPEPPNLRRLWPFALPYAYLGITRLLLSAEAGIYPLRGLTWASAARRLGVYLVGPLIPLDIRTAASLSTYADPLQAAAYGLTLVASVLTVVLLVRGVLSRGLERATLAFIAAIALARVPGLLTGMQVRFLGLSLIVTLFAVLHLADAHERSRAVQVWAAVVVVSQLLMFGAGAGHLLRTERPQIELAGEFIDRVSTEIELRDPAMIVLVNDRVGAHGARAMLQIAAWPREDLDLVITNSYTGSLSNAASSANVRTEAGSLTVDDRLAGDQRVAFWGNRPQGRVANQGFTYASLETVGELGGRSMRATGPILENRTLLVGVDPASGRMLDPVVR